MGNFHSAHLECYLEPQQQQQSGNDTIKGTIVLEVHNPQAVRDHFDGITILVAGVEYCRRSGDHDKDHVVMVPTSKVIKVKSVIDLSDTVLLAPGKHEFPFDIALPTDEEHHQHYCESVQKAEQDQASSSSSIPSRPALVRSEEEGECSSNSTMSDYSDLSVSPYITTGKVFVQNMDDIPESSGRSDSSGATAEQTQIIFKVKASMKRKSKVPLSVDTDIKCFAKFTEASVSTPSTTTPTAATVAVV